jgi:hypothetical protein
LDDAPEKDRRRVSIPAAAVRRIFESRTDGEIRALAARNP